MERDGEISGVSWIVAQWSGGIRPQTSANKRTGERPAAHQQQRRAGRDAALCKGREKSMSRVF